MAKYKRRADGRYSTSITIGVDMYGKPHKKTIYGKTIKELEDRKMEISRQLQLGNFHMNSNSLFQQWAYEWFYTYKQNREYNTKQAYLGSIKNHIVPTLGTYKIKDIKSHHIQKVINDLLAKGKHETARKTLNALRQIFEKAIEVNMIDRNPCKGVELPKVQKLKKRALSDYEKNLIYIADLNKKQKVFVYTLFFTGLRREEILALTKADIDMEKGVITVNKAVVFIGNQPETKHTKSQAGNRIIPITANLKTVLYPYLQSLDGLIVFPSARGEIMSKIAYKRFWESILKRLNAAGGGTENINVLAPDITAHLFRHTYATMLYEAGVDIKSAQALLGHADIKTTLNIYTHLDDSKKFDAIEKLDQFLNEPGLAFTEEKHN